MTTLEMQPASPPKSAGMHPDEWQARVQLAACYRIFDMLGWTEMIYNHITLRVPASVCGGERHFLINPFGLHYSEVCASNLVKIDAQGRVLDTSPYPVNPAGFVVHAAIHEGLAGRVDEVMRARYVAQRGMFTYAGLNEAQVERLRSEHAVYVLRSGRMCVAGLNARNAGYVASSIAAVVAGA